MTEDIRFTRGIKFYFRYFSHDVAIVNCMLQSGPLELREIHRMLSPVVSAQEIRIGLLRMKQRGIVKTRPGIKQYTQCQWYVSEGLEHQLSDYLRGKYAVELSALIPSGTYRGARVQG